MITWLSDNIGTIAVAAVLLIIVILLIVKVFSDKKKGRSSCGCNCANCPMSQKCHGEHK